MRTSFSFAVAAALLVSLSPVHAANPPKGDGEAVLQKDAGAVTAQPVVHDDDTSNVILLDQNSLEALPNPYANPSPRMVSDVWAMRT
jgi:hypothetical protein